MTMSQIRTTPSRAWRTARRGAGGAVRKCVPTALVPALATARSQVGRRRAGRREAARGAMQFILGESAPATSIEPLIDAYLWHTSWRMETRWRPELINQQQVVGLEHVREALSEGKGCLLSFVHHGDYIGSFASIARVGQPVVIMGAANVCAPNGELWLEQYRRAVMSDPGVTMMNVNAGSAGLREQFRCGRAVGVALDYPGHTPTRMFGRDLMLSSGGTRVAMELDTPVVTVISCRSESRRGGPARLELSPALFPRDFASPEELHAELARRLEQSILARPEAMDQPLRMLASDLARPISTR